MILGILFLVELGGSITGYIFRHKVSETQVYFSLLFCEDCAEFSFSNRLLTINES